MEIEELQYELDKARAFLAGTSDGMCIIDAAGRVIEVSNLFCEMLGYQPAELIGEYPSRWDANLSEREIADLIEFIFDKGERQEFETVHKRKDGSTFVASVSALPISLHHERLIFCLTRDITRSKEAQESLDQFGRILDQSFNEIFTFDAESLNFLGISKGACLNLGYSEEEMRVLTPVDIKPLIDHAEFEELVSPLKSGDEEMITFETFHERKDGSRYPVEIRLSLSKAETSPAFIAIVQDVSARKNAQAEIEKLAFYDSLTGLPNRAQLKAWLAERLNASNESGAGQPIAMLYLDLNRFKEVNDTRGHHTGDALLQQVAKRFQMCLENGERIARVGGDEFVVIIDGANRPTAVALGEKLRASLSTPVFLGPECYSIDVSVGVAIAPCDGTSIDDLVRHADVAMYRAKVGGFGVAVYSPEIARGILRRSEIAQRLNGAVENGDLHLVFQPQVDMSTGQLVGVETLARWTDPVLGSVSPGEFIPIAEERGLVFGVGDWVLEALLLQLSSWRSSGFSLPEKIALNISPVQFTDPGSVGRMPALIEEAGFPSGMFELEITEQQKLAADPAASQALRDFQQQGMRISVDDFGTGFSSLSAVRHLKPDKLKIDLSFVQTLSEDDTSRAIINATLVLGDNLGIEVIAEGVETREQLAALKSLGCNLGQGYLFDPPLSPELFAQKWLSSALTRFH